MYLSSPCKKIYLYEYPSESFREKSLSFKQVSNDIKAILKIDIIIQSLKIFPSKTIYYISIKVNVNKVNYYHLSDIIKKI